MPQSSLPDKTYYIDGEIISVESQCTCRCMVLPDKEAVFCLAAPWASQCTYRCVVRPDFVPPFDPILASSQCAYRCVVLPDTQFRLWVSDETVSMHLQVRGAP